MRYAFWRIRSFFLALPVAFRWATRPVGVFMESPGRAHVGLGITLVPGSSLSMDEQGNMTIVGCEFACPIGVAKYE